MLPLRYLFDNRELAQALLDNWRFDADDPARFQRFRISSNAIYPFHCDGRLQFLRFAPPLEKPADHVRAELEFIAYLRLNGYPALEPVPASDGRLVVEQKTTWGDYVATAFATVPGVHLSATGLVDEIVTAYGAALGRLHALSREYQPKGPRRRSHEDVLRWCRETLASDATATAEVDRLAAHFAALPRDADNYGLVHYDFECDNVLWDESTKRIGVIDFDDAIYHWNAMDVEQALDSLLGEVAADRAAEATVAFMRAYRAAHPGAGDLEALRPACRRFADLYWVARVTHSTRETFGDEPDWMTNLRARIADGRAARVERFGSPINA